MQWNWPSSQSQNAHFPYDTMLHSEQKCTVWMEHCGIKNRCILGFVKLVFAYFFYPKLFAKCLVTDSLLGWKWCIPYNYRFCFHLVFVSRLLLIHVYVHVLYFLNKIWKWSAVLLNVLMSINHTLYPQDLGDVSEWIYKISTLRPRQNDAIFPKTFWNEFSWKKMYEFWLKFQRSLYTRVQ